jgi:hypothetical protein
MRPLATALPLAALATLLAAAAARGGDPETIALLVGDETKDLGVMPRCDDLAVVAVTASGRGVRGVRPGTTVCSFDTSGGGGIRRIVRIVVRASPPPDAPGSPSAPPAEGGKAGTAPRPET